MSVCVGAMTLPGKRAQVRISVFFQERSGIR